MTLQLRFINDIRSPRFRNHFTNLLICPYISVEGEHTIYDHLQSGKVVAEVRTGMRLIYL